MTYMPNLKKGDLTDAEYAILTTWQAAKNKSDYLRDQTLIACKKLLATGMDKTAVVADANVIALRDQTDAAQKITNHAWDAYVAAGLNKKI